MAEYLTFQHGISEKTLFENIYQLLPSCTRNKNGKLKIWKYWDITYNIDFDKSPKGFYERLEYLMERSVKLHGQSDVPVGSYVSGGIDLV